MKDLKLRVFSAFTALLLMYISYFFYQSQGLFYVGLTFILIASWEYGQLSFNKSTNLFAGLLSLNSGLIVWLGPEKLHLVIPISVMLLCILIWLSRNKFENSELLSQIKSFCTGVVYTGILPSFALNLFLLKNGILIFIGLLVMIFSADVFAYFGGVKFGKTPFYPQLSPKKSVEGALFGIAGSMVLSSLYFYLTQLGSVENLWKIAGAAVVIVIASQTGDLFESLIKRVAGAKDSGKIMPGHGGALDRLDAVYFAAPLYWFWISFVY